MKKRETAADIYNAAVKKFQVEKRLPSPEDIQQILDAMEWEFMQGCDSLISFFLQRLEGHPQKNTFLNFSKQDKNRGSFDAWFFLEALLLKLENGSAEEFLMKNWSYACTGKIRSPIKNERNRFAARLNMQKNRVKSQKNFQKHTPDLPTRKTAGLPADNEVTPPKAEQKISMSQNSGAETNEYLVDAASRSSAEEKPLENPADEILRAAQTKADQILNNARSEAAELMKKSQADIKFMTDRAASYVQKEKQRAAAEAGTVQKHILEEGFQQVQSSITQLNQNMLKMQQDLNNAGTEKIYRQLNELYNMICDLKDSDRKLADQTENQALENSVWNLNMLLDMVSEYLAEYGIVTIVTPSGSPLNPRVHEVRNQTDSFDPRNSVVRQSLRNGFAWGEQILQKEWVIIE